MLKKIKSGLSMIAAHGAVLRRGVGALRSYPGTVTGEGYVKHNSGPKKGQITRFKIEGEVSPEIQE